LTKHQHHEEDEQAAVIEWSRYVRVDVAGAACRLDDYLFAIPNGAYLGGTPGQRAFQMARLKKVGFRGGASDLVLSLPRGSWHAFYLEMKKRRAQFRSGGEAASSVTKEQQKFARQMTAAGYLWLAAFGFDEAKTYIEHYLAGRDPRAVVP
jgi:hypothetical protein